MVLNLHGSQGDDSTYREVLDARRRAVERELATLTARLEELEGTRARLEEELHHLRALLGEGATASDGGQVPSPTDERPIADLVVELLREVGKPLHYREIEELLRSRGIDTGGGKDPANTLLARYFNDPRLYRPARGTYALRQGKNIKSVGTRRRRGR